MDFIFTPLFIKRIGYLIVTISVALMIFLLAANPQHYWLIWTAFFLSSIPSTDTFRKRFISMCATSFALLVMIFLAGIFSQWLLPLDVFLVVITGISVYLVQKYHDYFFSIVMVNLLTLIAGLLPVTIGQNVSRVMMVFIGAFIALLFQCIEWPYFKRHQLRSQIILSLKNLAHLNQEIFYCFLQADYPDNIYLYEKRLHVQKNQVMQTFYNLRQAIQQSKMTEEKKQLLSVIMMKLDFLYDITLDAAQLRLRVSDHTTFALCQSELLDLAQEIQKNFSELKGIFTYKNPIMDTTSLELSIKKFEENFQNVLQVAAREPLVFMLFIASMKALRVEMAGFYEDGLKARDYVGV